VVQTTFVVREWFDDELTNHPREFDGETALPEHRRDESNLTSQAAEEAAQEGYAACVVVE
jgi:hypothetical protein